MWLTWATLFALIGMTGCESRPFAKKNGARSVRSAVKPKTKPVAGKASPAEIKAAAVVPSVQPVETKAAAVAPSVQPAETKAPAVAPSVQPAEAKAPAPATKPIEPKVEKNVGKRELDELLDLE